MTTRLILAPFVLLVLTACQSTSQVREPNLTLPPGTTRIALMPMDIELYELSASGVAAPKADWTEKARRHARAALGKIRAERGLMLVDFETESLSFDARKTMTQIVKLHNVVGLEILRQRYIPALQPPTKADGRFDWSIGPQVQRIGRATGADYALFVTIRDSYSSSARVLMNIAIAVLFGGYGGGGHQIGYASLVELQTGDILWFGTLSRESGDLREAGAAEQTMRALLAGLPGGKRPAG